MKIESLEDLFRLGKVHIDYMVAKECKNPESYFSICVKCGQCGRKFENGIMIDDGGTTVESDFDY